MADAPQIDHGGPAFPVIPPVDDTGRTAVGYPYPEMGMTLRQWYAGRAMQGLLASQGQGGEFFKPEAIVSDAWTFADMMIAAEKGGA